MIRWVANEGLPYQRYLADVQLPPRPASHLPGITVAANNDGKAKVTWGALPDVSTVAGYKVRHKQYGSDTWTTSSLLGNTVREHVLSGLTHQTVYEMEVGVCVHDCGPNDEYALWSEAPRPVLGVVEDWRAWWMGGTPKLVRRNTDQQMFYQVDANRIASSTQCSVTEDSNTPKVRECSQSTLVSQEVIRASKYLVEATVTTREIETPATETTPAVFRKIGTTARRFHHGYDGYGHVNEASVSGGNGKIAVSWNGIYQGIGRTFTKGGKTYKVKGHDANIVIYNKVGENYWNHVRVERINNGYYEITGLTNGQEYRVEVWPCMATIEIDADGEEVGQLQQCANREVTVEIHGVNRQQLEGDPGMILGLPSVTMLATPSATATDKPGPVWEPTQHADSGPDEVPGNTDDVTNVRWGPPLPSSTMSPVLYYELRYRRWDHTAWTEAEKRFFLPEGVSMRCKSTVDEFDCEYIGRWNKLFRLAPHEVEIRARNVNGYGPWVATGSDYVPLSTPADTTFAPPPLTAEDDSPESLVVESHYELGISSVRWDAPTSGGAVTGYKVEWSEAVTGTTKQSTLGSAARSYDIGGKWLARWVRVAAVTSAGDAWSAAMVATDNPLQVWFVPHGGGATPKVINNQVFMNVATNKMASATCNILEGRRDTSTEEFGEHVNCPPGTLVSLPQPTDVTFPVWAEAESLADSSDRASSGPVEVVSNGPLPPDAWASGGNGKIRVVWNEVGATFEPGRQHQRLPRGIPRPGR